ncbi:MAG: ABC transporter ATP-binding protein [Firmicutes bacterium]|nr:ABC transporter ATP-binding protein [Bacillota bacterium]
MITLRDVHASYEGAEILHGIDADFPEGKISVLMGPNGCGKSTTLRSLLRLVPQCSGKIELDGKPLSELSTQELARRIAYLPQSRSVPDIAVRSLVMHGRFPYLSYPRRYRPQDHEIVRESLERVGLTDLADRKMEQLSGGQRQKAYLAMALAQDTDVILMDEPTTFLDIRNQFEMQDRSRALADSGKTVIMILHDFESILRYADHAVLLHEGRVLQAGRAEDVLRSASIREAFQVTPVFYEGEDGLHCYVRQ